MRLILTLGTVFLIFFGYAHANTEKTIFLGPSTIELPRGSPNLEDLHLVSLAPERSSLRTKLPVSFPTPQEPRGNTSVYLLRDLTPRQRYEVRICWAATQPTDFTLVTHTLTDVFESPQLIQTLASYAEQQYELPPSDGQTSSEDYPRRELNTEERNSDEATALFLYVYSAAAFYTTNQTLMQDPPPVLVDIILDPYLLNILPRSLLPTAGYLIGLAIGGWYISGFIWDWLSSVTQPKPHVD